MVAWDTSLSIKHNRRESSDLTVHVKGSDTFLSGVGWAALSQGTLFVKDTVSGIRLQSITFGYNQKFPRLQFHLNSFLFLSGDWPAWIPRHYCCFQRKALMSGTQEGTVRGDHLRLSSHTTGRWCHEKFCEEKLNAYVLKKAKFKDGKCVRGHAVYSFRISFYIGTKNSPFLFVIIVVSNDCFGKCFSYFCHCCG